MLVVTSENELNDSGKVLCEVELIEGDLFAILYSEDFNIDLFLEKFTIRKADLLNRYLKEKMYNDRF
ncbi:hypothetical protein BLI72_05425 [Listeria monocytogenes]|nr:hypothetical protein [Listeria monocytogenes]